MSRAQEQRKRAAQGPGAVAPWSAAWTAWVDGLGDGGGRRERGREYLGAGAVCELHVEPGRISAHVQGSRIYRPTIVVQPMSAALRAGLRELTCAEGCSPRALLRAALTTPQCGVLPQRRELSMVCTCPDRARPCKHLFAALYAVGPRLEHAPELLFALRGVELDELPHERPRPRSRSAGSRARVVPVLRAARVVAQRPAPAKTVRVAARQVRRAELQALGVPARTIDGWIRQGILRRTTQRGVYRRTAAVDRRLAARGLTR